MPITFCKYCGKYIPFGKNLEWGNFCDEECFEKYQNIRAILYDLKLEYWRETHPRLLHNFYDRKKNGGLHFLVGEE